LNVLVLFPPVPCLKWPQIIGDVLIAVWIAIQTKEHLHRLAPFIVGHLFIGFPVFLEFEKSE
jgi:hypothetical protein